MLKISTLGGLFIKLDDQIVRGFVSRKAEALLIYLACEPGTHSREELAALLWSDAPRERGLASLRTVLSSLQEQVSFALDITRSTVAIKPEQPVWVDALELDRLLKAGIGEHGQQKQLSLSLVERIEELLLLYRGDFLAGFYVPNSQEFEDWMLKKQEQLRYSIQALGSLLIEHFLDSQAYQRGIAAAEQLLRITPLDELLHRQLMNLLMLSGQRSLALSHYERMEMLLREHLGSDPEPETTDLYRTIQGGGLPRDESAATTRASSATPFIQRQEMARILSTLQQPDCRLLTIVGPGGAGKTRLAMETAQLCQHLFKDGTQFIPLATISDKQLIPTLFITSLGLLSLGTIDPERQILDYLQHKEMLLILDNFEHLLEGSDFLQSILQHCRGVKVLVTSREQLNFQNEWIVPIEGLDFPDSETVPHPETYQAVQLFIQSALRVNPHFKPDSYYPAIVRILQMTEGLPLAIEMAASWLHRLSPDQIVEQLEENLENLEHRLGGKPPRHSSLRGTFNHSWNLLSAAERQSLMRLTVFQGSFSPVSAEAVAQADFAVIASLIEKSLLRLDTTWRYSIHELIRRFAYEQLAASDMVDEATTNHLSYYAAFVDRAEGYLYGPQQKAYLDQIEAELSNLRAAMGWALKHDQVSTALMMATKLEQFWRIRGYVSEGTRWIEQGLALYPHRDELQARAQAVQSLMLIMIGEHSKVALLACLPTVERLNLLDVKCKVLCGLGIIDWIEGRYQAALVQLHEALDISTELNLTWDQYTSLHNIGITHRMMGQFEEARHYYQQCLAIADEEQNPGMMIPLMNALGNIATDFADQVAAQEYYTRCLELARQIRMPRGIGMGLHGLGRVFRERGELAQAYEYVLEAIELTGRTGDNTLLIHMLGLKADIEGRRGDFEQAQQSFYECFEHREHATRNTIIGWIENVACLAISQGAYIRAVTLFGAAAAFREALGSFPTDQGYLDGRLAVAQQALAAPEFQAAYEQGKTMTLEQACSFAQLA